MAESLEYYSAEYFMWLLCLLLCSAACLGESAAIQCIKDGFEVMRGRPKTH